MAKDNGASEKSGGRDFMAAGTATGRSSEDSETFEYRCLLDNIGLPASAGEVELGSYSLRYLHAEDMHWFSDDEGRSEYDGDFLWAITRRTRHRTSPASSSQVERFFADQPLARRERWQFTMGAVSPLDRWPFNDLLLTLNLMKASGPVIACTVFGRFAETGLPAERQLQHRSWTAPTVRHDGTKAFPDEYELSPSDTREHDELASCISRCSSSKPDAGFPDNTHLRLAFHFFQRADQDLRWHPESHQALDPLVGYEQSLEALLLREKECKNKRKEGDAERLGRRAGQVLSEIKLTCDFVRRVHWIRSKYLHAVRPIHELVHIVCDAPNDPIDDAKRPTASTPGAEYDRMILRSHRYPDFLANLREVTRQCIRSFCREYCGKRSKDDVLDGLDS